MTGTGGLDGARRGLPLRRPHRPRERHLRGSSILAHAWGDVKLVDGVGLNHLQGVVRLADRIKFSKVALFTEKYY